MKTLLILVIMATAAIAAKPCLHTYFCAKEPCFEASCPAFPEATCVNNYCEGCNAEFYVDGKDVTKQCNKKICPGKKIDPYCPPEEMVKCFASPCSLTTCPAYATATCEDNYCGGCNAIFTYEGEDVTACCNN